MHVLINESKYFFEKYLKTLNSLGKTTETKSVKLSNILKYIIKLA